MRTVAIDAHAIGARQGGNESYAAGLLAGLAALPEDRFRYRVLLTPDTPVPGGLANDPRFSFGRVSAGSARRLLADLPAACRAARAALLHTQYHVPPFAPCPTVVTLHDVCFLRYPATFPASVYWRLRLSLPYAVRAARAIVTDSEFSRREILGAFPAARAPVIAIPLGCSAVFRPTAPGREEPLRAAYSLSRPYILSVANLQPRKNFPRIIEAFALFASGTGRPHDLVIVGQELWLHGGIMEAARRARIAPGRIRFTGYVPETDLASLYTFADAFIYASLYEGFGLPILEAMACGCPVIASDRSSMPEVAGGAAIPVNPEDVPAMAAALAEVTGDPATAARMRTASLERARAFSWRETARRTVEVYVSALGLGGPRPCPPPGRRSIIRA